MRGAGLVEGDLGRLAWLDDYGSRRIRENTVTATSESTIALRNQVSKVCDSLASSSVLELDELRLSERLQRHCSRCAIFLTAMVLTHDI